MKTSSRPVELWVRLRADVPGQGELLDQRHEVGPVALERSAVTEVDLLERDVGDSVLNRRGRVRKEAAAERPREVAEAQVEARGLHARGRDAVGIGADPLLGDRLS